MTLIRHKKAKSVLCEDAGKDFVEVVLDFLLLPTGVVLKLVPGGGQGTTGVNFQGAAMRNVFRSLADPFDTELIMKASKDVLAKQGAVWAACSEVSDSLLHPGDKSRAGGSYSGESDPR